MVVTTPGFVELALAVSSGGSQNRHETRAALAATPASV